MTATTVRGRPRAWKASAYCRQEPAATRGHRRHINSRSRAVTARCGGRRALLRGAAGHQEGLPLGQVGPLLGQLEQQRAPHRAVGDAVTARRGGPRGPSRGGAAPRGTGRRGARPCPTTAAKGVDHGGARTGWARPRRPSRWSSRAPAGGRATARPARRSGRTAVRRAASRRASASEGTQPPTTSNRRLCHQQS